MCNRGKKFEESTDRQMDGWTDVKALKLYALKFHKNLPFFARAPFPWTRTSSNCPYMSLCPYVHPTTFEKDRRVNKSLAIAHFSTKCTTISHINFISLSDLRQSLVNTKYLTLLICRINYTSTLDES